MNKTIEIEGREDIIRDMNSKAVLKTNLTEKEAWIKKKERDNKIFQNENEINKVKEELGEVKNILNDIKQMLRKND
tara:strand:- start:228 stop:455 length:228 start_codon:yes stop_codon:yes gene_type:complete